MEHHQQLLLAYQKIHSLSEQMITLAQAGQWDALIEMEITYVQAVEKTAQLAGIPEPSSSLQDILRGKLQQILKNETEVKRLMQRRMDELTVLIGQSTRQSAVNSTYGQFHDRALLLGEPQSR
ncbi:MULTISPECIES: flagella biosynthesis regulatory protein FliT [Serratia]|uniref:Flagellar protein FliT n=1 Tax=Serratia fonticola TaxID=47917 RepID=A0AAP7F721_SERFO|nr:MULTISPECIES: flagella biosynthesis regulatory protein FliT [Serratia]ERK12779.1 Flagellar biosynthesis protein FliT [Serratia fonticola AU-AP2C]ALX95615.1 flagellar biosynthesis protein FliT [Serratia fonticola]MBC3213275.1 flagella biosynthesis regulatory protein FliT [Serratia fonticola]MBP0997820.1 flagella biosynthesis regulatory protein FliT [Serratia fonticola]MBP1004654.1 flagella biosynthesis regulatory protein FliT [Serratia fonticola]